MSFHRIGCKCCGSECPPQAEVTIANIDTIDCAGCEGTGITTGPFAGLNWLKWLGVTGFDGVHTVPFVSQAGTCLYAKGISIASIRDIYDDAACTTKNFTQTDNDGIIELTYDPVLGKFTQIKLIIDFQSGTPYGSANNADQTYAGFILPGNSFTTAELLGACSGVVWRTGGGTIGVDFP